MYRFMSLFKQSMLNTSFIALFISLLSFVFPSYINLSNTGYIFVLCVSLASTFFIENNDNYSKSPLIYHVKNIVAIIISLFIINLIFKVIDLNFFSILILNIIFSSVSYALITAFYIYYNRKNAAEINKKLEERRKASSGENNRN